MVWKINDNSSVRKTLLLSVLVYAVWVFATYMLEGRVSLFHRYDPMGRILFVVIANLIIGIVFSFVILRVSIHSEVIMLKRLGLRPLLQTIIFVIAFGAVGFGIFFVQRPESLDPVVVLNVFSQVLPVSIAEVVVCWAVIGTGFEALTRKGGRTVSLVVAILVADILFGLYHFGHSAPFNQVKMVFFLMIPGLGTSLVYFLARDLYAAIVFHNFLGMYGIMQSINLDAVSKPVYPLYITAFISVLILVALDIFLLRRARA
jgi:hypothetical protein